MFKAGQLICRIFATQPGDEEFYGRFLVLGMAPGVNQHYKDTEGRECYASSIYNYYKLLCPNGTICYLRSDHDLLWNVMSNEL